MAINLNLDKYGAQFSAFVNFANENAADEDTFARIGGALPYPGFRLKNKTLDIRTPL